MSAALFDDTAARLRACRLCRDSPLYGPPLPQEPRPIVQGSAGARLCIASQAPGTRAHSTGMPFMDPSGVRLRAWLGLDAGRFYDPAKVAIVPMGACFPGLDAKGGDRPPRRECAERWRAELFAGLPNLDLILVIGQYAQAWHLGRCPRAAHRHGAALARDPGRAAASAGPAPAPPVLAQQRLAQARALVRGGAAAGAEGGGGARHALLASADPAPH